MIVITTVLAVIAVVLAVGVGYLFGTRGTGDGASVSEQPSVSTAAKPTVEDATVEDPAAALEAAGVNVVMPPPVPDAPEEWGDYELAQRWDGKVNVSPDAEAEQVRGPGGAAFPSSMNGCGELMYLVTFRAVDNSTTVDARLVDAVGGINDSKKLSGGWMLGTNCSTPSFAFDESRDHVDRLSVEYTLYEYRKSALTQESTVQWQAPAPAGEAPADPAFVECLFGTPGPARFSDGSVRFHQPCQDTPEAQRSMMAERVCGGLGGREIYGEELYDDLCR